MTTMNTVPFVLFDNNCSLFANPDLYPLGLRVGFYLQWFATIMANFFVPKASQSMRTANTLFQLAMFSSLCFASMHLKQFDAIEAFIMLTFCIGSITALTTSPNMDIRVTRVGSIARLFVFLAVFIYGGWFWFQGHAMLLHSSCTKQIQFLFFWRVHLFHWFMHFSQAIMILGSIGVGVAIMWESFQLLNCFRRDGARVTFTAIFANRLVKDSVLGGVLLQEKYAWVSGALLVITVTVMAAFVTTIEGALRYSNAGSVGKIGNVTELVPFLIGLWNVLKVTIGMAKASLNVINHGRTGDAKELDLGA